MDNKCPYCGQPMPKSSTFCMHCMHGVYDKDYKIEQNKKSNKNAVILCILAVVIALSGTMAFAVIKHKKSNIPLAQSTTVSVTQNTTLTTTQKPTQTTTAKPSKKASAKKKSTTAPPTVVVEQKVYETTPQTTKAQPTTASNNVVINGSVLSDYPNTKKDSTYTIPYSVTSIAGNAFHGNQYLRTLKFSKRTNLSCNWSSLFANLPNLEKIYIYTGTTADTQGMQYFDGEIIYYYD